MLFAPGKTPSNHISDSERLKHTHRLSDYGSAQGYFSMLTHQPRFPSTQKRYYSFMPFSFSFSQIGCVARLGLLFGAIAVCLELLLRLWLCLCCDFFISNYLVWFLLFEIKSLKENGECCILYWIFEVYVIIDSNLQSHCCLMTKYVARGSRLRHPR